MVDVYILYSITVDRYYVGLSSDFEKALNRHNSGKNKHTKSGTPWNPVYREQFPDIQSAKKREEEIKSSAGREILKSFISSERNKIWSVGI